MLRVLIEVEQPTGGMRKLVLRPGQQLDFGSSEYAHVALHDDAAMSATHFRLRTDREALYLQDLDSSNGTYVNDEPVESVVLRDGDRIRAGQSHFRVSIEGARTGGEPPRAAVPAVPAVQGERSAARATADRNGGPPGSYTVEACPGGLVLFCGDASKTSPAALADHLARQMPLYLLVDFHKLPPSEDGAVPNGMAEQGEHLIDWLGEVVAEGMSPRFFAAADFAEWPRAFQAAWGADALVCLFSSLERDAVLAQLRRAVRGGDAEAGQSIVGCCWPSVLGPLLRSAPPETTGDLTAGIEAIFVESRDRPQQWCVFGSTDVADSLQGYGLEEAGNAPQESPVPPAVGS